MLQDHTQFQYLVTLCHRMFAFFKPQNQLYKEELLVLCPILIVICINKVSDTQKLKLGISFFLLFKNNMAYII